MKKRAGYVRARSVGAYETLVRNVRVWSSAISAMMAPRPRSTRSKRDARAVRWLEEVSTEARHCGTSPVWTPVDRTGRQATVRESDHHGVVIDHFHLLKVGERWSIVSKLRDAEP